MSGVGNGKVVMISNSIRWHLSPLLGWRPSLLGGYRQYLPLQSFSAATCGGYWIQSHGARGLEGEGFENLFQTPNVKN